MRLLKQTLAVLGAFVVSAAIAAFVAPKAARAVASAMVEVANTAANPVPNRDVDDRDRAAIGYATCELHSSSGLGVIFNTSCFTVPAGQRFVIDQIDGSCSTLSGNVVFAPAFFFTTGGVATSASLVLTPQSPAFGAVFYAFNQPVHYVADPESILGITAETTDLSGDTFCTFNFSGHLVSYP